ncbi:chitinase [Streptomyces sp. NPDC005931]|uniref:chitinase n=1 Tax=Streptomyces sp. NPDC005931 TaxID=3364737 RepID=UPI003674C1E5
MRGVRGPAAAMTLLLALATTGCTERTGTESTGRKGASAATAYAPYVSATTPSATDATGSPTAYNLAFVISSGSGCTPRWNGSHAVDAPEVTSRIARLRKSGAAVRVSFGGAAGKELAAACDSAARLAKAYATVLDAAGATRADFDIEGDELTDPASVARRSEAIALLQKERTDLEVSFTLPVMPSGLDADSRALLDSANDHGVRVSLVNLMTMNYGESYDGDMGDYALAAAEAAHTQLKKLFGLSDADAWRGMALTSMIGVNDVEGETFTLADATQVRAFAEDKGIAWVSMWSTARDRPCPDGAGGSGKGTGSGDAATDCSGVQQAPGAFAKAFAG